MCIYDGEVCTLNTFGFRNIQAAQKSMWLSWPILTVLSITTCFSGLTIYSKYHRCDPYLQKRITSPDMLMPLYVMDTMSSMPGLPGLFIAGIFAKAICFNNLRRKFVYYVFVHI